jgi:hypothetical protein
MPRVICAVLLLALLACQTESTQTASSAHQSDTTLTPHEAGADLLARPYTIRDMVVDNMAKEADRYAELFDDTPGGYRPKRRGPFVDKPNANVVVAPATGQLIVAFDVTVVAIDDPWEEVCRKRLDGVLIVVLGLPSAQEPWKVMSYFGHHWMDNRDSVRAAAQRLVQDAEARWTFVRWTDEANGQLTGISECAYSNLDREYTYSDTTFAR